MQPLTLQQSPCTSFCIKDIEFQSFYKFKNSKIIFTFILVVATTQSTLGNKQNKETNYTRKFELVGLIF